ncbi:MAG: ATP-dependent DNA helicase RecG [Bacteroides sp.]|nr:ATP-dependent DNA helicase RecG [Bacteroides sp.]MCM1095889.1 ATP-dependent DNA helicase RecG [Terasakiella sp.]
MNPLRRRELTYVKGIGPERAKLLERQLGMRSARDLLYHFPTGYVDRSTFYSIRELEPDVAQVQVKGRFVSFNVLGEGAKTRLCGLFTDGTATLEVTWFKSIKYLRQTLHTGTDYVLFGKPTSFNGRLQMTHPEVDTLDKAISQQGMRGVYPLTDGLRQRNISSRSFHDWTTGLLGSLTRIAETLPESVISYAGLDSLDTALRQIHAPSSPAALQRARLRLKFEELFYIQVDMLRRSRRRKAMSDGFRMPSVGATFNSFYSTCLPFPLTGAQKRVVKEIRADLLSGRQMNRLVQGDVGSGKTVVALMSMLLAVDNGFQACMMAPTEILAGQHYESLRALAAPVGVNVRLLTGSTRRKEREEIHAMLASGELHILVGTHAVLEDPVKFRNLGLAVIDEQHRFGVAQRARLWAKNTTPPHVLVMTATPIPRTLAMTVYGDLDVSVIDELPPGRKPVMTLLRYDAQRQQVYRGIGRQLAEGRQVYIVYPLIDENEKLDMRSLNEDYDYICDTFSNYRVAFVHGRLKPAEKDHQMELFASGQAQILVATTVIEVGVNVPNATTMVIENAERFGLSQLHQLRGRVGRGADQSYCILMSKYKIAKETRERLQLMTRTTDGFEIAEADMRMRGPGDIEGTMQSGMPFELHIANPATDGQIIELARRAAEHLLDADPELTAPANAAFAAELREAVARNADWSRIS